MVLPWPNGPANLMNEFAFGSASSRIPAQLSLPKPWLRYQIDSEEDGAKEYRDLRWSSHNVME